jgi:hypothetical protein
MMMRSLHLAGTPAPAANQAPPSFDDLAELFGDPPHDASTRFDLFARNGFVPLLLPAGHPEWVVAPESNVGQGEVAKVPMYLRPDGLTVGYTGWTTRAPATERDMQRWQRMGCPDRPANVSLRTGQVTGASFACDAIDIDVDCPALAPKVVALARQCFGMSPRRTRPNSPRALMLYRLAPDAAELSKIRQEFVDRDGCKHAVEILLRGQQCIVAGVHKSGAEYEWPDGYPVAAELPEIGSADIERFLNALSGDAEGHEGLVQREGCTLIERGGGTARQRTKNAGKRLVEEDEEAVRLAREALNRAPDAEWGKIDDTEARLARSFFDFGVSQHTCLELLQEWNDKRGGGTSLERLKVIAASAERNRDTPIGWHHPLTPGFEAVEIDETKNPRPATNDNAPQAPGATAASPEIPPEHVRHATPVEPFEDDSLPPRPWILTNLAQRSNVTILAGNPGAYKSTYAFPLALAAITGRNDICGFPVKERTSVWIWNQEEPMDELRHRLSAAMKTHNVSWDDLKDANGEMRLHIDSGFDDPLILAKRRDRTLKADNSEVNAMVKTIKERKVGLMIVDPMSEFHEGNENDNTEMRIVMGAIRSIAVKSNCAAVVFAHTAKPPLAPAKNYAGHQGAIRGASSQAGAARIVATVFRAAEIDETKWILPGGHKSYIRVDVCKINGGPEQTVWLKHEFQIVGSERVKAVRHVPIEPKIKEGEPDILTPFARAMAEAGQFNQPVLLKTLIDRVPELTADDKEKLTAKHGQPRKRWLDEAFGGKDVTETMTDQGKLMRSSVRGGRYRIHAAQCDKFQSASGRRKCG